MHLIPPRVPTTCIGMAAAWAPCCLAGRASGKRSALPNSRILIHQAPARFQGTAADIEVNARKILRMNAQMNELMEVGHGPVAGTDRARHQLRLLEWRS
jgi:ATP-dependent Clp protease protease subunit